MRCGKMKKTIFLFPMEELISSGADVSHLSLHQLCEPAVLHWVAYWDRVDVVRLLQDRGVDLRDTPQWSGASPMGCAITSDSRRVAAALFWAGARPSGWTCAEYANHRGRHILSRWFVLQGEILPDKKFAIVSEFEQLEKWRGQFCACRTLVVAWLGVKRFRGRALVHVDRFLMRQIAMAIWQTRGE